MKLPTETKRYCPYCRARPTQKVSVAKQITRSATQEMSPGYNMRLIERGLGSGPGKHRKYSREAPKNWKRKSKTTKRIAVQYTCSVCKKTKGIKKAIRTSRLEIGEKVAK